MFVRDVTVPIARKSHRCWWCWEQIEPGEEYIRWPWKDAGQVVTIKLHPECKAAWDGSEVDEIMGGEYCRGCTCERGCCECGKGTK